MTVMLFWLVVVIIVVGFLSYLIGKLPIDEPYKSIAKAVLVFILVLYVIFVVASLFGIPTGSARLP